MISRRNRLLFTFWILVLVAGISWAFHLRKPKVFVIGDSISMHYGPYLKRSLEGFFEYDRKRDERQAQEDLDNPIGANGGDSGMVRRYLDELLRGSGFQADYMLINCGLHDIKAKPGTNEVQVPIGSYEENIKAIVKQVDKLNARMIWVTTTPVVDSVHNGNMSGFHRHAKNVEAYIRVALDIMKEYNIPVIDLFTYTEKFSPDIFSDHVHFTEEIREKQGDFIAGALTQIHRLKNKK